MVAWSVYAGRVLAEPSHSKSVGVRLAIETGVVTVGAGTLRFAAASTCAAPGGKALDLGCSLNTFLTVCGG